MNNNNQNNQKKTNLEMSGPENEILSSVPKLSRKTLERKRGGGEGKLFTTTA